MSQIGNNIKKLRKVKGLSQQAFADLFNLTRGNISSYEEFRAEPRIETILKIAKYFSIPVSELLEKQLTVNEILNFEDHFETPIIKVESKNLSEVPFLNKEYLQNADFGDINDLPKVYLPIYNKHQVIAVENSTMISKPVDFPFDENAILFFEQVDLDILHTLDKHYGFYHKDDTLFFGQYKVNERKIKLSLNDWMKVVFSEEDKASFWKLYAKFEKV